MSQPKNQNIESENSPLHNSNKGKGSELFGKEYYEERQEEAKMQQLKAENEAAYYQEIERKRVQDKLYLEIKKYLDDSADISLVEKEEILGVVKKFTENELSSLMDKILKDGLKEGIAQIKSQRKFMKGKSGND